MKKITGCILTIFFGIQSAPSLANEEIELGQWFCEALEGNIEALGNMANKRGVLMTQMERRLLRNHLYYRDDLNKQERQGDGVALLVTKLYDPSFSWPGYDRRPAKELALEKCAESLQQPDEEWLEVVGRKAFRTIGQLEAYTEDNLLPYRKNEDHAKEFCQKLDYNIAMLPKLAEKYGVDETEIPVVLVKAINSGNLPDEIEWTFAGLRVLSEVIYSNEKNGDLKAHIVDNCDNELVFVAEVLDSNRQALYADAFLADISIFDDGFSVGGSIEDSIFKKVCEAPDEMASKFVTMSDDLNSQFPNFHARAIFSASEGNGWGLNEKDRAEVVAATTLSMLAYRGDLGGSVGDVQRVIELGCSQGEEYIKDSFRSIGILMEKSTEVMNGSSAGV